MQAAWDEAILEKVLRCVTDPTEKCRELAIQLIRGVAEALTEVVLNDEISVVRRDFKNLKNFIAYILFPFLLPRLSVMLSFFEKGNSVTRALVRTPC